MTGNNDDGFEFVPAATVGCKSNYRLGTGLCSAIANLFKGPAQQWWDDYVKSPVLLRREIIPACIA